MINTETDSVLKRLRGRIEAHKAVEEQRIVKVREDIDKAWREVGKLKYERNVLTGKILWWRAHARRLQKNTSIRTRRIERINIQINERIAFLVQREERAVQRKASMEAILEFRKRLRINPAGIKGTDPLPIR